MAVRQIVEILEELCDGCGDCVPSCQEGAIKIVHGKAKLAADALCDGLGACLGHCPKGAIRIIEREADDFVMPPHLVGQPHRGAHAAGGPGSPGLAAFAGGGPLDALRAMQAGPAGPAPAPVGGCPGSRMRELKALPSAPPRPAGPSPMAEKAAAGDSALSHWPVQIGLVPPHAPFLRGADLLVAADCVPVAVPHFHRDFLDGRAVMIGCPKFDDLGAYTQRFAALFAQSGVARVSVVVMEVPCCQSLPEAVRRGRDAVGSDVPVEKVVVGVDGQVMSREAL